MKPIRIFVEKGSKRVISGGLDWPGLCRSNRNEDSAIQALVDYGLRYKKVMDNARLEYIPPVSSSGFSVVERVAGNSGTDFGIPIMVLQADRDPLSAEEFGRFKLILSACWKAFDQAVRKAGKKELRKGPRGGGRETLQIIEHVSGADLEYLKKLPWKFKLEAGIAAGEGLDLTRKEIFKAMDEAYGGRLPEHSPTGGALWPLRYYIRRVAWHVLDHAWEIEDRL